MAGSKTAAKNSRTASKTNNAVTNFGDAKLITPCNAGKNAYVRNPKTGLNPNLSTSSDAFIGAVRELTAAGLATKVRTELEALNATYPGNGWDGTLAALEAAGAFEAAA